MSRHPCGRSPPDYGGKEAYDEINPDAGDGRRHSRPFACDDPDLRRVADESGSKIHQAKPHFFNGRTEVLAHKTMASFMNGRHGAK